MSGVSTMMIPLFGALAAAVGCLAAVAVVDVSLLRLRRLPVAEKAAIRRQQIEATAVRAFNTAMVGAFVVLGFALTTLAVAWIGQ